MGSSRLRVFDPHLERKDSEALPGRQLPLPTFDVPYFKYIDEEDEDDEWSSRSQSSTEDDSVDSLLSDRYVVVSGTPEKILEHLLNDLHLAEVQHKETDTLLDDFLLTYTVFMTTDDLCQALLRQYPSLTSGCSAGFLRADVLHYELTAFLNLLNPSTVDEYSPQRKNKALFHQFSLKENWLQHRGTVAETEERIVPLTSTVFCHVYITEHSYVSVKAKVSSTAQEILKVVAEKLQRAEEDLALVAIMFSGEKHEFQPNDLVISKSLEASGRIFVYRKDLADTLNPFADNEESQQRPVRILGMNTWDLALELMSFDWSLFNSIHEQELIYFTFSRQGSGEHTVNLSLLLQRCNEVQLWVATEILLCSQLGKRVQLVKKFIKIAAHCKAQQNLNSFFAIVMGLNTASVSRLSQTWEHMIADTVRTLRHCRTNQFGSDMSPKEQQELKSYVNHLYVIDSQQALFELSHRLEPRA
ncbi:Rap guanine nucleotide exchange factor (GEF) 5 [Cricetulus griseus]